MGAAEFLFTKKHKCPVCGKTLDAGFSPTDPGAFPEPNDVTICAYCSAVLQYNEDLSYREANMEEIKTIDPDMYQEIMNLVVIVKGSKTESKNRTNNLN